jgi:hypothetical protein
MYAQSMRVEDHVEVEALHVESNLSGIHLKVFVRKSELMIIDKVVHLPKFVLGTCGLCCLCCMMGPRVRGRQREIAKDITQPVSKGRVKLLNDEAGFVAVWTGIVAVPDESDCPGAKSANVISVRYGNSELGRSSSRHHEFLNFIAGC